MVNSSWGKLHSLLGLFQMSCRDTAYKAITVFLTNYDLFVNEECSKVVPPINNKYGKHKLIHSPLSLS
jgi:hypothetical protein